MSNRFPPLCLVIGLALAGCSGTPEQSQWTSAEAPKTLQVDHMRLEHATAFAAGSAELDAQEMARLETFLDQAAVRSGDKIYLSLPAGDRLAAQRIGRIARQLDQRGLGARTVPAPSTGLAPDHLLLVVDRYIVTPPACPNWTKPADAEHGNDNASDYGCSTAANLGSMIDDPRDLVVGRVPGPADSQPGADAVARWRSGNPKWAGGSSGSTAGSGPGSSAPGGQ